MRSFKPSRQPISTSGDFDSSKLKKSIKTNSLANKKLIFLSEKIIFLIFLILSNVWAETSSFSNPSFFSHAVMAAVKTIQRDDIFSLLFLTKDFNSPSEYSLVKISLIIFSETIKDWETG
jgi:uncharacterized membrane protein YvbJ